MATDSTTSDSYGEQHAVKQMDVNLVKAAKRLIFDQAGSLEDGIREGVQNGVDAPNSSEVQVVIQPSQQRTIIYDDGDGMDLSNDEVEQFLTELFESTKDDADASIGQFGIGFAQMLAKAKTTVYTREYIVQFDARQQSKWSNSPIDYRLFAPDVVAEGDDTMNPRSAFPGEPRFEEFDGFWVELEHYDDQVPASEDLGDWDDVTDELRSRFKFIAAATGVRVYLNGEDISQLPGEKYSNYATYEDEQVYIALKHSSYGNVSVYSNGIHVENQYRDGVKGYVVTKQNLSLNMSRDEVKSDCPVWAEVEPKVADLTKQVLQDTPDTRLSESGRTAVARLVREGHDDMADREVFETANGETVSLEDIADHDSLAFAPQGHRRADKMLERGFMVLREPGDGGDDPNRELQEALSENVVDDTPDERAIDQWASAHGVSGGYETLDDPTDWNATMAVVETVNDQIAAEIEQDQRDVRFGQDESRKGWTDGESEIVVTETAWHGDYTVGRILNIWRHLCHEYAHEDDTEGVQEAPHGDAFARRFRRYIDATEHVATHLIDEVQRNGKKQTMADHGHPLSQYRG